MNICLWGCKGFIGSNLFLRLYADKKINIVGYDDLSFGDDRNGFFTYFQKDISVLEDEEYLNRFDVIILSYCSNIIYAQDHVIETFKNNALTALRLLDKFKGKVINLSTSSVYNEATIFPTPETAELHTYNAYDSSKLIVELFLKQRGNYTTLRLSNVFGTYQRSSNPYCGVVSRFFDDAMNDRSVKIIGNGSQSRDFTYVDDVVDAVEMAVNQEAKNTEINIGTGEETLIRNLAVEIFRCIDKIPKYEFVHKRSIDTIDRRCLDITKAKELLGWIPKHLLYQGLAKTYEWIKSEK